MLLTFEIVAGTIALVILTYLMIKLLGIAKNNQKFAKQFSYISLFLCIVFLGLDFLCIVFLELDFLGYVFLIGNLEVYVSSILFNLYQVINIAGIILMAFCLIFITINEILKFKRELES